MATEENAPDTETPVEETASQASAPVERTDEELFAYIDNMSSNQAPTIEPEVKPEKVKEPEASNEPAKPEIVAPEATKDSTKTKESDGNIKPDDTSSNKGREDVEADTVSKEDLNEVLRGLGIESKEKLDELYESSKLNRVKVKEYGQFDDQLHIVKEAKLSTKDLALATEALSGNMDAIKKILKDKGLDPVDLIVDNEDGEEIKIDNSKYEQDDSVKAFKEATYLAKANNVETDFINAFNGWDETSLSDMMQNKHNVDTFVKELSDGSFEKINNILKQELDNDFSGKLESKDSFDQYIHAQQIYKNSLKKQETTIREKPPAKEVNTKQDVAESNNKKLEEAKRASEQTRLSDSGVPSQSNDNMNSYPESDDDFFAMFDKQFN